MVLQVFRRGFLYKKHEREQMTRLINYLHQAFSKKAVDCSIIIDPKFYLQDNDGRELTSNPDAIIFKDNEIIIIELKSWKGKIYANCRKGQQWENEDKTPIPVKKNPFVQVTDHRNMLTDCLINLMDNNPKASQQDIARHIKAWVVTSENSKPILNNPPEKRGYRKWFKVLPVEQVHIKLELEKNPDKFLTNTQFTKFRKLLNAVEVPHDKWYNDESLEDLPNDQLLRIPKINHFLNINKSDRLLLALHYIEELDLHQYVSDVNNCCSNKFPEVRLKALKILIDWNVENLSTLLSSALSDPYPPIVDTALDYLENNSVPETFPALSNLLRNNEKVLKIRIDNSFCNKCNNFIAMSDALKKGCNHEGYIPQVHLKFISSVIMAIVKSGNSGSCDTIMQFADSKFEKRKFGVFCEYVDALRKKGTYTVSLDVEAKNIRDLFKTTCKALGELKCKKAVKWLMEFVKTPRRIGFEHDAWIESGQGSSLCISTFENAVRALGKTGDKQCLPLLYEKLDSTDEVYQHSLIVAIGEIGDSSSSETLVKFLENEDLYDVTVQSLGKTGGDVAFDALAPRYISNPDSQSGMWICEVLASIDKSRFETILLNAISNPETESEFKNEFFQALRPIASIKSADVLFSLLKDPDFINTAQQILSNLSTFEPKVRERAEELVKSSNPIEQASGIRILEDDYIGNPNELAKFERKPMSVEVRRAVTEMYRIAGSIDQILKYANDPDKEVRSNVFESFYQRDGIYQSISGISLRNFFLSSDKEESERCNIIVDRDGLAIKFSKKVIFLKKKVILKTVVRKGPQDRYGVYLKITEFNAERSYLLVPIRYSDGETREGANQLNDRIAEITKTDRKVPEITDDEVKKITSLWNKVPIKFKDDEEDDEDEETPDIG